MTLEAGFAHQSHMARCMRRMLGVTPSALYAARALSRAAKTARVLALSRGLLSCLFGDARNFGC